MIALWVSAGCKTTNTLSQTSSIGSASADYFQIGFETRPTYVDANALSLTFDDGPDAVNTPKVLDILKAKNVKASFFINSLNWGDIHDPAMHSILKRILAEGHELANHTANHLDLATLSEADVENQVASTMRDVEQITGKRMTLIRAPFGSPFQLEEMGTSQANYDRVARIVSKYGVHVGWNFDSFDYNCTSGSDSDKKKCVINNVMTHINQNENGVILFHSVHAQTVAALPELIDTLRQKNKKFVLIEDILKKKYGKSSAELVADYSKKIAGEEIPSDKGGNSTSCAAQNWEQGRFYKVGSQVVYQNQLFTAINQDNPGYDPKISTWFWQAGPLCSSVTAPVEPSKPVEPARPTKPSEPTGSTIPSNPQSSNCSAPAWQAGTWYEIGAVVVYQGQLFTAQNERNPGYDPKISTWFWRAGELCR